MGINVLSLFDGMSCGQLALSKLGIVVDKYYASEIDKYAMKVTKHNFPNTIMLGDICNIKGNDLPKIDLLIGGSPCQNLSIAGDRKGLDGEKSKLFFEYVRLLKEVNPTYFLLENVKMKKESKDVISNCLGVEPLELNSSLVSAQSRNRLYWTNIPNITAPKDNRLFIKDVINCSFSNEYPNYLNLEFAGIKRKNRLKLHTQKSDCLTSSMYKGQICSFCKNEEGQVYKYTPNDCEILQTVPLNYTASVSNTQRYKMLGNGWTVDIIAHILKGIKNG